MAELDAKSGTVKIGAMICFDLLFPEAARALMLEGAELILVPNASRNDENHRICLRARSVENMAAVAQTNYAAPQQGGLSVAFDAVSYAWNETAQRSTRPSSKRMPAKASTSHSSI